MASWTSARTTEEQGPTNEAPQRAPEPSADARWGNAAAAQDFGLGASPAEAPATGGQLGGQLGPQPGWASDEGLDDEPASPERQLELARRDAYVRAAARELLASLQADYVEAVRSHVAELLADPYARRGGEVIPMASRAFRDQLLTSAELCVALGLPRAGTAFLVLDVSQVAVMFRDVTELAGTTSAAVTLDGLVHLSLSGGPGPGVTWNEVVGSAPSPMTVWPAGFVTGEPAEVRFTGK